jgi:hypothetical protein
VVSAVDMPTKGFVEVDKQCSSQRGMLSRFYGRIPFGITGGLAKTGFKLVVNKVLGTHSSEDSPLRLPLENHRDACFWYHLIQLNSTPVATIQCYG